MLYHTAIPNVARVRCFSLAACDCGALIVEVGSAHTEPTPPRDSVLLPATPAEGWFDADTGGTVCPSCDRERYICEVDSALKELRAIGSAVDLRAAARLATTTVDRQADRIYLLQQDLLSGDRT